MKKGLWEKQTSIYDKSPEKNRAGGNTPQHNKDYKWQIYSQYHTKCRIIWNNLKSRMRQGCSLFSLLLYIFFIVLARKKTREGNNINYNLENKLKYPCLYITYLYTWYLKDSTIVP